MRTSSQLLLTFLLNAFWQIALVAALASFSSWLLRNSSARYRHWIWIGALVLSLGIPLATSAKILRDSFDPATSRRTIDQEAATEPFVIANTQANASREQLIANDVLLISRTGALLLMGVYIAIVIYGLFRLLHAWHLTRRLKLTAVEFDNSERVSSIIEHCAAAITGTSQPVLVRSSESVPVPVTIGLVSPVIILPRQLLTEGSDEVLTSAIGHELIHVQRLDYALNLLYEFLYLPLSFHPAAGLIRRRIRQTRELSCDELVAERLLNAEVYARSLVKLASSVPPLRRLSVTTTVGIADADILEARIMSLLRKSKMDTRGKRMLLITVSLLLLVPCIAAASFAMKFDVKPSEPDAAQQESSQQEKERKDKEQGEARPRVGGSISENEFKERMKSDPQFREEVERKRELEMEMRAVKQAALVRLARINMDQAIQIATSQQPGKVLQCSLDAEHWEEPGKLAKDSFVFYRVIIVSGDDADSGAATHVWVNAVDGSIIRTEKELPRKQRRPE